MARARVLVVEDDESVQDRYRFLFEHELAAELSWVLAPTATRAELILEKHPSSPIDIIVLDWNLPDAEGIDLLKRIKANPATRSIPVLMVTGYGSAQDAARGIETGADDYLKKDFGNEEFVARLRNLLRRGEAVVEKHGGYEFDGLVLNPLAHSVTLNGAAIKLRGKEFALLAIFMRHPGVVHSSAYLARALSDDAEPLSLDALRHHCLNLREALGPWSERIENLRGEGYRLNTQFPVSH
jgi:DNA-binding response OmpR family regulator